MTAWSEKVHFFGYEGKMKNLIRRDFVKMKNMRKLISGFLCLSVMLGVVGDSEYVSAKGIWK